MLEVSDLSKQYQTPRGPLQILSGVSFSLKRGDAAAIMGRSGAGKSTLLHILGTLDEPTSGTVTLDGRSPFTFAEKELSAFRNQSIGFIFQEHCLLPQCSALENVLIPTLIARDIADYASRARELLGHVGLSDRVDHRPSELSGGEKQRVAVARALIRKPLLLLCDEPTGNLDEASADAVASLLLELPRCHENILIIVTHNSEIASRFPLRYELRHANLHPTAP
jgi:lipoprotein-releasing system ATP-binding protein